MEEGGRAVKAAAMGGGLGQAAALARSWGSAAGRPETSEPARPNPARPSGPGLEQPLSAAAAAPSPTCRARSTAARSGPRYTSGTSANRPRRAGGAP